MCSKTLNFKDYRLKVYRIPCTSIVQKILKKKAKY